MIQTALGPKIYRLKWRPFFIDPDDWITLSSAVWSDWEDDDKTGEKFQLTRSSLRVIRENDDLACIVIGMREFDAEGNGNWELVFYDAEYVSRNEMVEPAIRRVAKSLRKQCKNAGADEYEWDDLRNGCIRSLPPELV